MIKRLTQHSARSLLIMGSAFMGLAVLLAAALIVENQVTLFGENITFWVVAGAIYSFVLGISCFVLVSSIHLLIRTPEDKHLYIELLSNILAGIMGASAVLMLQNFQNLKFSSIGSFSTSFYPVILSILALILVFMVGWKGLKYTEQITLEKAEIKK